MLMKDDDQDNETFLYIYIYIISNMSFQLFMSYISKAYAFVTAD